MKYLELEEEYNKEGVCTKRSINGATLPSDNHPSVCFTGEDIKNADWINTREFLTLEQAKQIYGYDPTTLRQA